MKALTFSRVCLIGALMLGIFITWSIAVPQQISADRLVGADIGCACSTYDEANCGGSGCGLKYWKCTHGGEDTCYKGGSPHNCISDINCNNHYNEFCD